MYNISLLIQNPPLYGTITKVLWKDLIGGVDDLLEPDAATLWVSLKTPLIVSINKVG